jgi:phosphoglycolate phosphatase-like HAD superfamily hydrolase
MGRDFHADMPACPLDRFAFVIWDFDGTLFDLDVDWDSLRQRLHALLRSHRGGSLPSDLRIDTLVAAARDAGILDAIHAEMTAAELGGMTDWDSGIRVGPTGHLLRRATTSAIVSNNMSATIRTYLRRIGLPDVPFRTRDIVSRPKPAPDGLDALRHLWTGGPAVIVGDTAIDAQLAANAGIEFIHVKELDGDACESS